MHEKNIFKDIQGHSSAKALLEAAITKSKIAPAYLFTGPEGVGKKLTSIRFLEGFIYKGISSKINRARIENFNHPDLLLVEPTYLHQGKLIPKSIADNELSLRRTKPQIRLEQIKSITNFLSTKPLEADTGMVIIDGLETINESAANALLKTLEEPSNGILILISNTDSILPTILSRCQIIKFNRLTVGEMNNVLKNILREEEGIDEIKTQIMEISNGSPGGFLKNINIWKEIPNDLWLRLQKLPLTAMESLDLARDITELIVPENQIWIIDWLQINIWSKEKDKRKIEILEKLRKHLLSFVQPRLAWEVTLLEIYQNKYN